MNRENYITGKITRIEETQTGFNKDQKPWKKRGLSVIINDQHSKNVHFDFFGQKVDVLDLYKEGQIVDVYFNLESKQNGEKFFNNITGYKITLTPGK